jgi:hypothetical protein
VDAARPAAQRCKDKARIGRYLSLTAAEPLGGVEARAAHPPARRSGPRASS